MSFENFDLFTGEYRDKSLGQVAVPTEQDVLSEVARGLMGLAWPVSGLRWVDKATPKGRHLFHYYMGPSEGMWATPMAQEPGNKVETYDVGNARRGDSSSNFGMCLSQQVKMWPTPRAGKTTDEDEESWRSRQAKGDVSTPPLSLAVKMHPTPKHGGMAGGSNSVSTTRGRGDLTDDEKASMISGSGGQLSPTWVSWLMGFPLRWLKKECEEWFR